ncbi:hypothetical protein [uncultured Shewanella sp.]|uniref:hypothetical protein n=1 Tax=uncultured Shewanella sp. TaxID=173975 RepID=UPI002637F6DF|nr:hypothetical protein [uncultured Shewanella sp.]
MRGILSYVLLLVATVSLLQWFTAFTIEASQDPTKVDLMNMDHSSMKKSKAKEQAINDKHSHANKMIPKGVMEPKLDLQLFEDVKSGYNLHIIYDGFELESPEFLDSPEGKIEGHAHLFINGKKIQRVYGAYLHLDSSLFQVGINSISVTLNSHEHDTWSIGGEPIVATYFINTQKTPFIQHYFSAFPL